MNLCTPPTLPRDVEVNLPLVRTNPKNLRSLREMVANLPDSFRRATVQIEVSFNVVAAPTSGYVGIVPLRNTHNLGQGYDLRPAGLVQMVGFADVAVSATAGEAAFGQALLDGFDGVEIANTLDLDITNVRVAFKVIATPNVQVKP